MENKNKKKLTILAVPISAVGHINACVGALSALLERGHRIIFLIEEGFKGKLSPLGYEEFIYQRYVEPTQKVKTPATENTSDHLANWLLENKIIGDFSPEEKLKSLNGILHNDDNYSDNEVIDGQLKVAIEQYKPDLFYVDNINLHPAIYFSKVAPFILNISLVPNYFIFSDQVPPAESGLPSNGSKKDFERFNTLRREKFYSKKYNDFLQAKLGYPDRYPNDNIMPLEAASLIVYAYPDELNFPFVKEQMTHWFNLEAFSRVSKSSKVSLASLLPVDFLSNTLDGQFTGRYILLSMGSLASVDIGLMKRFVEVLKLTKHKVIVSKGQRGDEYELADNMWGEGFIKQTAFLPHVDLVICHGGNNTVTESFTAGKPMIVAPQFSDQSDNAQRLVETGFGARIDPYHFTDAELLERIEKLLNDQALNRKLQIASRRLRRQLEDRHKLLADKIEQMLGLAKNI